jgi:hypothetical protein
LTGLKSNESEVVIDNKLLTYKSTRLLKAMPTFDTLVQQGTIIRVRLRLGRGQFDERELYALPDCLKWMKTEVPSMVTGRVQSHFTPSEQLITRLLQWITGKPMAYGRMFQDMLPKSDEVWELKTADLRIFGWMYRSRKLIAVCGGYADHYKEPTKTKYYADDRQTVVDARNALPLDGNKFVTGAFDDLV